jgi:selenide, water dikinase
VLLKALRKVEILADEKVLVGYGTADDAAVYRLDEERALVQTVDFFTPLVDDPYLYGQIAAANALSDIYAMGASPLLALTIVAFPQGKQPVEILGLIMQGGADKMREAGVPVVGGHSIQDAEIKFGYCVTGLVHPDRFYTNAGARTGDELLLTKPIGTGIIATGLKFGKASPEAVEEATQWMLQLNRAACEKLSRHEVHSVTDITGYGLLGHACEMAVASGVSLHLEAGRVPLMGGVEDLARLGMLAGGIRANRDYLEGKVDWNDVPLVQQQILLDPQTSGGLLISLSPASARELREELEAEGRFAALIGRVAEKDTYSLVLH